MSGPKTLTIILHFELKKEYSLFPQAYSEPSRTSKMDFFAKIGNGVQLCFISLQIVSFIIIHLLVQYSPCKPRLQCSKEVISSPVQCSDPIRCLCLEPMCYDLIVKAQV